MSHCYSQTISISLSCNDSICNLIMLYENTFDELKFKIMRKLVPELDNSTLKTSMPFFDIQTGIHYQVDLRQDNESGWEIERIIKM